MDLASDNQTPEQLISQALEALDSGLRKVLILHHGIAQTPGLPYDELENRMGQPIEDLIATEKTAIRNLRHPSAAKLIVEAIRKGDRTIWQTLADENNVVYKDNLNQQLITCLPGELLIGIKCLYENVFNWLNHHAYQTPISWYRSEYPEKVILATIKKLIDAKGQIQTPLPFLHLVEQLNIEKRLLKQVLALSKNRYSLYRGYVCDFRFRARTVRAVRLHLMFCYRYPNQILPIDQIHAEYLETYSDDDALLGDIVLSMVDNPHLFIKLGSLGWYSIMSKAGGDPYREKKVSPQLHLPDKDKTQFFYKRPDLESTLVDPIKNFVRKRGMVRPKEVDTYIRENYKYRVDESTQIAPLVAGSPDLLQVAPTVYALRETHARLDPQRATSELLLTKSDLRWYVMSRHTGEPMHTFPLWTPMMEHMWCGWAQKKATNPAKSRLFQTLMAVADPACWPVPDKEKKVWMEIKKWNSSYHLLHKCKHRIWSKIPPLRDLLALSICLDKMADMNWIRVNRVAGYYLFDQHSVTHLAIMIALGALKPTDHWQSPHQIGPAAEEIFKKLKGNFQIDPNGSWDSGVGSQLCRRLKNWNIQQELGWIIPSDLTLLIKKLIGKPFAAPATEDEEPKTAPDRLPKQLELPF